MEYTPACHQQYVLDYGAFRDLHSLQNGVGPWDAISVVKSPGDVKDEGWATSLLNPKNRILSLTVPTCRNWRIDGASNCGRRIFAVPLDHTGHFPPLRIDIYLPELSQLSPLLSSSLDIPSCTHIRDQRFQNLGLARFVSQALGKWSLSQPGFAEYFRSLSFGSKICFETLDSDVSRINIHVLPGKNPRDALNVESLARKMNIGSIPSIALRSLTILRQLNERVALVKLAQDTKSQSILVFKSSTSKARGIYHEIHTILRLQGIPIVCDAPLFLVTDDYTTLGEGVVLGFIMPYFSGGALSSVLTSASNKRPTQNEKIKWARGLTETFGQILERGSFYSDLKCENLVLNNTQPGDRDLVLVDFEQIGASSEWTPPEIIALEKLVAVVRCSRCIDTRQKYAELLQLALGTTHPDPVAFFRDMEGRSRGLWLSLTSEEVEAAMVFMLGKVIFCLFENLACVTPAINPSIPNESRGTTFPHFKHSPLVLRDLILRCTSGAREHDKARQFLMRIGNTLYGCDGTPPPDGPLESATETVRVARAMRLEQLCAAERMALARARYRAGEANPADCEVLQFLKRPSLQEIGNALQRLG